MIYVVIKVQPDARADLKNVKNIIEEFVAANNLKTPAVKNPMTAQEVSENTQASMDALTNIEQFLSAADSQKDAMETTFHDQSDSYLCHSYAIISAFRQVIRQFFSSPLAGSNPIKQTKFTKRINLMNKNFSFHRLLTAFVTGVNPRSFTGLITRQSANLETAVSRLVYRTAVEVEGWKKMIPVRDYFTSAGLQVKSFNSWYRKD